MQSANHSSYTPFLIGQGQSNTGFFTYLESWVKPEDAFDELTNAYVYRGSLYQREGISLFPSSNGAGALVYQNNQILTSGNGAKSYSGTLSNFPIIRTSLILTATTAGGTNQQAVDSGVTFTPPWTSNAQNNLSGLLLDNTLQNTINYSTGQIVINTVSNVAANIPILVQYNFLPTSGTPTLNNPIMGIKLHQDATDSSQTLVVMDTRRASWWDPANTTFQPLASFQQILWVSDGVSTTSGAITIQWTKLAPYSISITDGTNTITDIPTNSTTGKFTTNQGNLNPDPPAGGNSAVNYSTGVITLTLAAPSASGTRYTITGKLREDYFTGDNTQFFNTANWQTSPTEPSYLYMTNNKDNITLFDGTYLARPPFATLSTSMILDRTFQTPLYPKQNDIAKTLDIKVYKGRLLFLRPTLVGQNTDGQSIRWSYLGEEEFPLGNFNFITDLANFGGEYAAPTGDWIQASQFLRDYLIVFFQSSTWIFRFTGNNTSSLFRWDKINGSRSTNAPYASVEYDAFCTSMGAKGLIACNGYEVERYDESIIEQIEDIVQDRFFMCYGQKFDTLNQTWMLYPSKEQNGFQITGFETSDKALIYNFLENTWAIFKPNLGKLFFDTTKPNTLSCLGLGFKASDLTWGDFAVGSGEFSGEGLTWGQANFPWDHYQQQEASPSLLGGDQNGFVYTLLTGTTDNPGPSSSNSNGVPTHVKTKLLNPFVQSGIKARYGYLDVYFLINPSITLTFNFYLNNSTAIDITRTMVLDGNQNNTWGWKRLYIGAVGEFLQIEITNLDQNSVYRTGGTFQILGMILYAKPAGRLTPGTFL